MSIKVINIQSNISGAYVCIHFFLPKNSFFTNLMWLQLEIFNSIKLIIILLGYYI